MTWVYFLYLVVCIGKIKYIRAVLRLEIKGYSVFMYQFIALKASE